MKKSVGFLLLFACCCCVPTLSGQQPVQVRGSVEDSNGAAVTQAAVKLSPRSGGTPVTAVTDTSGRFVFSGVTAGDYVLSVKMEGFAKDDRTLHVGDEPPAAQQVRLKIAEVKEDITVSARADNVLAAEQNASAVRLDGDFLRDLPAKYDGVLATASLFTDAAAGDAEGTKVVVDGVEGSGLDVPASSVKTVAVNSNPYSVEFSRPGKGRIDVTTRGGSLRRIHRRFELAMRNSSLDARNPFDTVFPPRQRQYMEGEVDGPLASGKATFFLGGDFLRDNNNSFITAVTPAGPLSGSMPIPARTAHALGRVDIRLTPLQILSMRYNWTEDRLPNQGVGAFNLTDRAWNSINRTHEIRVSETAIPSAAFLNEVRFDFKSRPKLAVSASTAPALLVNGAFNSGGAQVSRSDWEKDLEFQDLASYVRGKHTLRFGGVVKSRSIDYTDRSNFGGTLSFSDLGSFTRNQPVLYTINEGIPTVAFRQNEAAYFAQDEIKLLSRLNLLVGLRHEFQSNVHDRNNVAPRVALSFGSADGRTVLRAGGGVFYQRQPVLLQEQASLLDGLHLRQIVLSNPLLPLPGNMADLTPLTSVDRIDPRMRNPYSIQASISLERKFGSQTSATAEYSVLRGLRLYRMRNVNAPLPALAVRPDPNFLNVDQFESSGRSRYNSLSVSLRTAVARGRLQLLTRYTFSHSVDDTSGMGFLPANNFNVRAEQARSDFDQRHRLTFAGLLRLPWNFSIGCISSINSGIPYTVTTGFDNNNDTVSNDRPTLLNAAAPFNSFAVDGGFVGGTSGVLYDGAQAVFAGVLVPANLNGVHWLVQPGPGNVGRNTGNGPGFLDADLRLAKRFVLREKDRGTRDVEFRADVFNSLNRVNYMNFVGALTSPFFGQANDAHAPREVQLSIRTRF